MIKLVDIRQNYRVYDKDGISPTLTTPTGGHHMSMFQVTDKVRKLTPLECERLMGFPDNWTEGVSDTQRYKMLGNSVIVPVIEFIANKI